MYQLSLASSDHVRHYAIARAATAGWEVTIEQDRERRLHEVYDDWHRVERAWALFNREVSELVACGWQVVVREGRPLM